MTTYTPEQIAKFFKVLSESCWDADRLRIDGAQNISGNLAFRIKTTFCFGDVLEACKEAGIDPSDVGTSEYFGKYHIMFSMNYKDVDFDDLSFFIDEYGLDNCVQV